MHSQTPEMKRLTGMDWIRLLSHTYERSRERVVYTSKQGRMLRINKEPWERLFGSAGGFDFKEGREVRLVPALTGGPRRTLPEWLNERLSRLPGDRICLTHREGKFFIKKLHTTKLETEVPGWTVFDTFEPGLVRRECAFQMDASNITEDLLSRLLALMGRFRYDPLQPFRRMEGRIGVLARRDILDSVSKADEHTLKKYREAVGTEQEQNGSWGDHALKTAFALIRLVDAGAPLEDGSVGKGVAYLLSLPEPMGFPGLFMLTEGHVRRFNAWKEGQERGKGTRSSMRKPTDREIREYAAMRDPLSGPASNPCELRFTWTSGIVLEALLRCGLHQHRRVIRGINTLFAMGRRGGWCGCGYFTTHEGNYVPSSTAPVDFNKQPLFGFPAGRFLELAASIACGEHEFDALEVEGNRSLIVKPYLSRGECRMVVRQALSHHPAFPGSHFEANTAMQCMGYQDSLGGFGSEYRSTIFQMLERLHHPFSAFTVLRSIPGLIRDQGPDGLWEEAHKTHFPPPNKEETSYIILKTLKKFGFLDVLIPD